MTSFLRRWHPLEVGNILSRLVPRSPALGVDDGLMRSRQPTAMPITPGRAQFSPYTRLPHVGQKCRVLMFP